MESFSDSELSFRKHKAESLPPSRSMMMLPHFMGNLSKRTDYKYREAVERLRHLLCQYSPDKSVHFNPEVLVHDGHVPSEPRTEELGTQNSGGWELIESVSKKLDGTHADEIVTLLKGQDNYITHLEKENTILRKELLTFEDKIVEVIAENEKLLSNNRQIVTENIIGEVLQFSVDGRNRPVKDEHVFVQNEPHEISDKFNSCPDKKQYADQDRSKSHRCEKCDFDVMAEANKAVNITLQRISKERDELLSSNMKLKASLEEMHRREKEVEIQVKKGIELVEQTDLEKQQVDLYNSKLKEELEKHKRRLEDYIAEYDSKFAKEIELCRTDYLGRLTEAQSKLEEAVKETISVEHQLDKLALEKENLNEALHQAKHSNHNLVKELEKMAAGLKTEVAQEVFKREQITSELKRFKSISIRERGEQQQERETLQMEVDTLRRRSSQLEQDLFSTKEECLRANQTICDLQTMMSAEELAKKNCQRINFSDVKTLEENLHSRETQLSSALQQTEAKHALMMNELDTIAASQNGLIAQLTGECRFLSEKSRHLAKQYKNEVLSLRTQVEDLSEQLKQSRRYRQNVELQCDQHRHTHRIMLQQLRHLEDKLKKTSQQVESLLSDQQPGLPSLPNMFYSSEIQTLPYALWNEQYATGNEAMMYDHQLEFYTA